MKNQQIASLLLYIKIESKSNHNMIIIDSISIEKFNINIPQNPLIICNKCIHYSHIQRNNTHNLGGDMAGK